MFNQLECCGVFEAHYSNHSNVGSPERVLKNLLQDFLGAEDYNQYCSYSGRRPPYIIFTDRARRNSIKKIITLIKDQRLGRIETMPSLVNDNTGEKIILWVWMPNWKVTEKWAREPVKRKKRSV